MQEHRALSAILAPGGITPLYQPICLIEEGTASVAAFECLARGPSGTNFEPANVLFDYVRLKREEAAVDRVCVAVALGGAPQIDDSVRLTVNVHASTLGRDRGFVDFLLGTARDSSVALDRVTIEIVEHAPPWDNAAFLAALGRLRDNGVKIALDDVGLGQSNFKMMIDVRPDYLKIDRYFVIACDTDPRRRAVIEAIASLAGRFGAGVVAEGVESQPVVSTLSHLGVNLMQGFWFSHPLTSQAASHYAGRMRVPVR